MIERFEIDRGLDIPIDGEPKQEIEAKQVSQVALVADDYIGMRPTLHVSEGDAVEVGQPLFSDKKSEGVVFTSPVAGRVNSINRGEKRRFLSLIVDCDGDASRDFGGADPAGFPELSREQVVEKLAESGLWTSLRSRPFGRVPSPKSDAPRAIFVNAMDSNPLAADPSVVIAEATEDFKSGLVLLGHLTEGEVFLCRHPNASTPGEMLGNKLRVAEFSGPHPSGLVGTHMHFLKPASVGRENWYLNYQDVIAIGRLFTTGRLDPTRVIALSGPVVKQPRLIQTCIGASLEQLVDGELSEGDNRVVSGSVLCGRTSEGVTGYLGRYHLQVSCLKEGSERELFGWQMPGFDKFSVTKAFASAWQSVKRFPLTTSTGGSERAMVPIGTYEKVMPLDLVPTPLLRALISRDTASAQELGCLELDEEDLALCTFVCPGKYPYGEILRDNLLTIEKEG